MKFLFVTDDTFHLGPDNRWYTLTDFGIDYIMTNISAITEFVLWGRCQRINDVKKYYKLPEEVEGRPIRVAGPLLYRKSRLQWPWLLARGFFPLSSEVKNAQIVFLRMPAFYPIMAYHLSGRKQYLVMYLIGNAEETIPMMVPWARWVAPVMGCYCRMIAKRCDLSAFMSRALVERYANDSSNNIVCNNSRYPRSVIVGSHSARTGDPPRIVYLGRLSVEKGLLVLFEAVARLAKKMRVQLDVIGDGPLRSELEGLANALHILSCITWHGRMSGLPMFEILRHGDIFVLPSFTEGMPTVIPEAMSQGLPIVATDVGGVREVLLDGEAGLIVPPHDSEAMAQALEISITDMELRKRLIQKSLEQAEANCLENQAGKLVNGIAQLIRKDKQRYEKK